MKRLAILTEDHPLDYLLFEGIIPKGSYGAGTVIVWDTGTYTSEQEISDQFKNGHKLKGRFSLVKTSRENQWLLIGSFLPLTLYSGHNQLLQIIHNPAIFGIGFLLLMMLVKALLTSTSFAMGFEGGPVFPLIFMGGTLGLALSEILTFIPQDVGVTAGMAGVTCAVFPLPLTIALLLGLLGGQVELSPVIVIGAVTGFIVSKALTPLLPKHGLHLASSRNTQ